MWGLRRFSGERNDSANTKGNAMDWCDDFIPCPDCDGDGFIITCCDDLCHGAGYCIHGDGEETCPTCHGEGDIFDASEDDY